MCNCQVCQVIAGWEETTDKHTWLNWIENGLGGSSQQCQQFTVRWWECGMAWPSGPGHSFFPTFTGQQSLVNSHRFEPRKKKQYDFQTLSPQVQKQKFAEETDNTNWRKGNRS